MTANHNLMQALGRLGLSLQVETGVIRSELARVAAVTGHAAAGLARVFVALQRDGVRQEILNEIAHIGTGLDDSTFRTVERQLNQLHNKQTVLRLGRKPFTVVNGGPTDERIERPDSGCS